MSASMVEGVWTKLGDPMRRGSWEGRRRGSLLLPITPSMIGTTRLGTNQEAEEISIRNQTYNINDQHCMCFILFSLIYLRENGFLIIGRSWAKYRDLSVAGRSTVFIIWSPSLFSYFNHFLAAQGSDRSFFSRERGSNYVWAEYYLQLNTF